MFEAEAQAALHEERDAAAGKAAVEVRPPWSGVKKGV